MTDEEPILDSGGDTIIQNTYNIDTSGIEERLDYILDRLGSFNEPAEGEEETGGYYSSFAEVVELRRSEELADRILTKSFDEYSTSEGLLLALLLIAFLSACLRIIREAFSWL